MDRYLVFSLVLFRWAVYIQGADVYENISAVVGQDTVLPCLGVKHQPLEILEWTCDGKIVLVYREGNIKDGYEDLRYTDKVQLKDPLLHGGDFSLRLLKVAPENTGLYECFFVYEEEGQVSEGSRFIHLTVTEQYQDTNLILTNTPRERRGLVFGLMLVLVIIVCFGFALWRTRYLIPKFFKRRYLLFCADREKPRKRQTSCSSTATWSLNSEESTRAQVYVHRDSLPLPDLVLLHRPALEPLPPFSHAFLTSSLTRSTSDNYLSISDLRIKDDLKSETHISCPDMCTGV